MEYQATIEVQDRELRSIIAEYFGVPKESIYFTVSMGQREECLISCTIRKKVTLPGRDGKEKEKGK